MPYPIQLQRDDTLYPNPEDHGNWRACPGVPASNALWPIRADTANDWATYADRLQYCTQADKTWVVCLHRAGVLDGPTATSLLDGLQKLLDSGASGQGGENALIPVLGGDEDLASLINLGRTMQEPMSRLQMRDMMNEFFDHFHDFMDTILSFAERHTEAIMPGHTHFSQANPITLANYALSIFDNMQRGLDQLELSYDMVNRNSGGCGSTSGTVWPVDRQLMTELLGMDSLLEVTYDCEASQDHTMHLICSIANIAATLSKLTMDIEIWGLEEVDMVRVDPSLAGVSSMMPQKCHNGEVTEDLRNIICDLLGNVSTGFLRTKAEPHGDVLSMYSFPTKGLDSLIIGKLVVRRSAVLLDGLHANTENMLRLVKQGYSCMTEVVVYMVKELGYGGRRAHRICANLTRNARAAGIPAPELTAAMLDDAARQCGERVPGMSTEDLQKCLDPVAFIHNHGQTGGPAPKETARLIAKRRETMIVAREQQQARRDRVAAGQKLLADAIAEIRSDAQV